MQKQLQRITPFLWFNDRAEQAAEFYTSIFNDSKIRMVTHYNAESATASGMSKGAVMTVAFLLDGQEFVAINGGPHFKFSEAISFVVNCESQQEIDHYWDKLSAGGDPTAQRCGWLKDRYGVSWQIVPSAIGQWLSSPDAEQSARVAQAMFKMKKIDMNVLQQVYAGEK